MSDGPDLLGNYSYIWSSADDGLRDVDVRGKYCDVILPINVVRPPRRGVLEPNKRAVLDVRAALDSIGLVDQNATLGRTAREDFYTSEFNLADLRAKASRRPLRPGVEHQLDAFSPKVQDIPCNFGFHDQIPRPSKTDALSSLIEKLTSPAVNPSPKPAKDSDGRVILPGLGLSRSPTLQGSRTSRKQGDPDAWLE